MTFVVLERFSRVAPLGVRFWDVAAQAPVHAGLVVTARTPRGRVLPMFPNSKGVYVLQDVPGLRPFETGDGSDEAWAAAPAPQPYTLEARDTQDRFHTFTFEAQVPTKGILSWECITSPPLAPLPMPPGYVPAYPTAGSAVPGGMAAVRADLYDPEAGGPAAWAMLEVSLDGVLLGRGIADERGCAVVVFPYPEPIDTTPGSPMTFGVPILEQVWSLDLRAYYAPNDPVPTAPDLCLVLNQAEADLWRVWNSPTDNEPFTAVDLHYGAEAIARSFDAGGDPLPRLYVTPV